MEFWAGSIVSGPNNHILVDMEHVPAFIALLPTITGGLGILLAYVMYMLVPSLPAAGRDVPPVYLFLLNKWYFDELYDCLFVRPASGWPGCCGTPATRS